MKYWPVPNSYSKEIPTAVSPGSFWENRDDRRHCGVDIYAPAGSKVVSIDDGVVVKIDIFTSLKEVSYWNETKYVLIKNNDGFYCKYAELRDVVVNENEFVKAGQVIGHVSMVLNIDKITENSPEYIQKIKNNKKPSMLHFELFISKPDYQKFYSGGNWFDSKIPEDLLDPTDYLKSTYKKRKRV